MAIRIAQYKGRSLVSKVIKRVTRGEYSHTAIMLDDDRIVEAWEGCNEVRIITDLSDGHKPGTSVDIYEVNMGSRQEEKFREFVEAQLGKKYDYLGLVGFYFNSGVHNENKWFCSELFAAACIHAGIGLLNNVAAYQTSPRLASISPKTEYIKSIVTV